MTQPSQVYSNSRIKALVQNFTIKNVQNLFAICCLAVFTVVLWLPFGFKTTGLMEEWMIIHDWEAGGKSEIGQDVGLFVTTGTLTMRPMDPTAFILMHELSPNSFLGYNIYTLLTFFLKGLLLYAILRKLLPGNLSFAFAVAVLFVIFPADDGLFMFRGMNIHTAVVLYLLALYLLLSFYENPKLWKLLIIWLCLIVSLFTYELSHPLIAFTPFIFLWQERRLSKKVVRVAIAWWLAPLVAFLYAAFMFTNGETYQSWVLARSGLRSPDVLSEIAQSLWLAYRRHMFDGWGIAVQGIASITPLFIFVAIEIAIITSVFGMYIKLNPGKAELPTRRYIELFFIGIFVIFLGYIVYMITPYRQLTWRVYYFSSIGGAICIGSIAYLVSSKLKQRKVFFAGVMCILISLAVVRAFNQHQYYVRLSIQQQRLLRGVVGAVPGFDPAATLVIVDETGRYNDNWSLGASYLVEDALGYIYDDYALQAVLCYFDPQQNTFGTLPELRERCEFTDNKLQLYQDNELTETHNYNDVVIVRFTDQGATLLNSIPPQYLFGANGSEYNPTLYVDLTAAPPHRYETLFSISN